MESTAEGVVMTNSADANSKIFNNFLVAVAKGYYFTNRQWPDVIVVPDIIVVDIPTGNSKDNISIKVEYEAAKKVASKKKSTKTEVEF